MKPLPYVALEDIDISKPFPSGEPNFQCLPTKTVRDPILLQRCQNGDDLLKVLLCADALSRQGETPGFFIPFLPCARQDRVVRRGEALSLACILAVLRTAVTGKLYTFDCHSPVAEILDSNLVNLSPQTFHARVLETFETPPTLVIPDAGASKRLGKLAERLPSVQAIKMRDKTVTSVTVFGDVLDRHCLIVDDICDGGGTFEKLAVELYAKGAASVRLAVSHGLFTRGLRPLWEAGIKKIYTTDSWLSTNIEWPEYVDIFPISEVAVLED